MAMAALALALAGCMSAGNEEAPTYRAGFDDGCATASGEGRGVPKPPQRNAILYERDSDYRAGWGAGHAFCRTDSGRQSFGH
jgi:hypothetical protein